MSVKESTLAAAIVERADCLHLTGPAQAAENLALENLALVLRLLAYLGGRIEEAARAGGAYSLEEVAAAIREIDRAVTSPEFGDEEEDEA